MFAGDFLNSAGESDSTNSPLSTDGSVKETENLTVPPSRPRTRARAGRPAVVPAQHDPAAATATRTRPHVPSLQPLRELGVVGACRRGRRKGRRNRTPNERELEGEDQRHKKNSRERVRVQNVNQEYKNLRLALGAPPNDKGKVKKVATLNHAITYIRSLRSELHQLRTQAGEPPMDHPEPSDGSSGLSAAEPEGQSHMAGGYNLRHHHKKADSSCSSVSEMSTQTQSTIAAATSSIASINLSCDERLELNEEPVGGDQEPAIPSSTSTTYNEETYIYSSNSSTVVPPGSYFSTISSPDPPLSAAGSLLDASLLTPGPAIGEILLSPPTNSACNSLPLLHSFLVPALPHELPSPFPPSTVPLSHEPTSVGYPICASFEDSNLHQAQWMMQPPLPGLSPPTLSHYPPGSILDS